MWYEFFKFELKYRFKQPLTYVFFALLFLFSLYGVEFVFEGIDLGLVKKNAPIVIAKSMGAITGFSMIIASIIMGVPILRDVQYEMESLIYVNPISKRDYLLGHFAGSFLVLLFIFSGVLWGMVLGECLPWKDAEEFLPFQFINYLQPFLWVALPILFFGSCIFFITGALTKNLMVVYTQGIVIFVLFILTKSITIESVQALLDPFSLTTLSKSCKDWTITDRNLRLIPMSGIMLYNRLFWMISGLIILIVGYRKFELKWHSPRNKYHIKSIKTQDKTIHSNNKLPYVIPEYHFKAQIVQLFLNVRFHSLSILKLTSFWAIIVCCILIMLINSINLGTSYGVNSYPVTYLIIEELQEMSMYFFLIILVFYSGEIMWKEKEVKIDLIHDTTNISRFVNIVSRYLALLFIYSIVMAALILSGILFQTFNGYYKYSFDVYFSGFFLELFPFLALYTMVAIFFQALTGNKFVGMLFTIGFALLNVLASAVGFNHVLVNFGGNGLATYSEMNGYGHFLESYLWVKVYWVFFGILLLILSGILMRNGVENELRKRWKRGRQQMGKSMIVFSYCCCSLFISVGGYLFYNTNVLHEYFTQDDEDKYRAEYEKSLKKFEYIIQPKITDVHLEVDLFPSKRAYEIKGYYLMTNTSNTPIGEIHVQKLIKNNVELQDVRFDRQTVADAAFEKFHYTIYVLEQKLAPGDTMKMEFKQVLSHHGMEIDDSDTKVVYNGTFFDNSQLPGFGYQSKYELEEESTRKNHKLPPAMSQANREDVNELINARSGSDADGINLEILLSTEAPQSALSSGDLLEQWEKEGRNYFHYKSQQKIINFYPVLSANYEVKRDFYNPSGNPENHKVDLEIFYQKGHEYNLDRMMEAMKMSLDYCSTAYNPYSNHHLRIVEFPRYNTFAQSLPGIIPFSESSGFILDIDDEKDVDMAFFITAHEVAHQWWGMQLEAANVKGQKMILETLAQYVALMVFRQKYDADKVQDFLQIQKEAYRVGNLKSKKEERPLVLVENESHIYYNKGVISMYELAEKIGEEKINMALRKFLEEWKSFPHPLKHNRYSTTFDLMECIKEVTPDSMRSEVTNLFERI